MKKLLFLLALIAPMHCQAAGAFVATRTYEVGISSVTQFKVSVTTFSATKVDTPTQPERVSIEIQNIHATANLWCVPGVNISSAPVLGSRKITAGSNWVIGLIDKLNGSSGTSVGVYCMSDGTAATDAIVTQIH